MGPGQIVDLVYYGQDHQPFKITVEIVDLTPTGLLADASNRTRQFFPWTSVQRLIIDLPNDSVS